RTVQVADGGDSQRASHGRRADCNGRAHGSARKSSQNQRGGPRSPTDWKSLPGTFASGGDLEERDDGVLVLLEPQVAEVPAQRIEDHAIAHLRLELFD